MGDELGWHHPLIRSPLIRSLPTNRTSKEPASLTNGILLHLGVSENGGTQQPWVFLLKMIILGVLGVPPFKETPIWRCDDWNLHGNQTRHFPTRRTRPANPVAKRTNRPRGEGENNLPRRNWDLEIWQPNKSQVLMGFFTLPETNIAPAK